MVSKLPALIMAISGEKKDVSSVSEGESDHPLEEKGRRRPAAAEADDDESRWSCAGVLRRSSSRTHATSTSSIRADVFAEYWEKLRTQV